MSAVERAAGVITGRAKLVLAVFLVLTVVMGAGAASVEQTTGMEALASDSAAASANDYVLANLSARPGNTTTALFAVRNPDGNVLSRESLLRTLEYQQSLRRNASVNATLVDDRPTMGVANVVATAAIAEERQAAENGRNGTGGATAASSGPPPLDAQIDQLESMSDAEVAALVERTMAADSDVPGARTARGLMPREYEPGTAQADARLVLVTQETENTIISGVSIGEPVTQGQVAARDLAKGQSGPESYLAFGRGFLLSQQESSINDSLSILGPMALLFILVSLSIAYRDLLDVVLGLVGVLLVLVWTFGAMGWLGIDFSQVMIAVPILLIGLSVDYALHVVMRYREERQRADDVGGDDAAAGATVTGNAAAGPATDGTTAGGSSVRSSVRSSMRRSLAGIGPALLLVTLTTAIGFLANLTSPVAQLQEFGVATAIGIGATLVIFGVFLPALKSQLDGLLESRGHDRSRAPLGDGGRVGQLLGAGATFAKRAPAIVLVLALLVTVVGAVGAAGVQADYSPETFMSDDPPAWTAELPASMEPGEYFLKDNREYIYEHFQTPDKQVHLLVRGDVTDPATLRAVDDAAAAAGAANVTTTRASGEPAVTSPVSAMQRAADRNATFNATLAAADTDGDGVPDRDVAAVFDEFHAAAPDLANRYVHRTDGGEYAALRVRAAVVGTADPGAITEQYTAIADDLEAGNGAGASPSASDPTSGSTSDADSGAASDADSISAIATGQPIVDANINDRLISTIVEGLVVTLVAVTLLLAVAFRLTEGSATLGVVTLLPVAATVVWLLGTMHLLAIPLNMITALVGSIAIGLGVDYAIHVSERFGHEIDAGRSPGAALDRTVRGTGGALLSSAITTAGGFGVLTFSLLPGLRQFGFVLAVGIIYALIASVFVLPSLLALWARYVPGVASHAASVPPATADD